jgi:hypothetical protein
MQGTGDLLMIMTRVLFSRVTRSPVWSDAVVVQVSMPAMPRRTMG